MDPRDAFNELNPIALFAGCILPMVATPIGFLVTLLVRRIMPMVNILTVTIVAGYIVSVVVLFALIRQLLPETVLSLYGAGVVSLITAAGAMIFLAFFIHRKLFVGTAELNAAEKEAQTFAVFGEDVRDKSHRLRRRKK
jgi:hypothetical protein